MSARGSALILKRRKPEDNCIQSMDGGIETAKTNKKERSANVYTYCETRRRRVLKGY